MDNPALVVMTAWLFFIGAICVDAWPGPWGPLAALGVWTVCALPWWLRSRARRRARLLRLTGSRAAPRRVFWKGAGLGLVLILAACMALPVGASLMPGAVNGWAVGLLVLGPWLGWALVLVPLLVGALAQAIANTAAPRRLSASRLR